MTSCFVSSLTVVENQATPTLLINAARTQAKYKLYNILRCLLLFYVLGTSKIISGWVLTCDSSYSYYIAALLGDHAASTVT